MKLLQQYNYKNNKVIVNKILIAILTVIIILQLSLRAIHSSIDFDEGYNLTVSLNIHKNSQYASFEGRFDPYVTTGPTVLLPTALFINNQYPLLARIPMVVLSLIFIFYVCLRVLKERRYILLFLFSINFVPFYLFFSSHVLGEIPALLFITLSFTALLDSKFKLSGFYWGLAMLTKSIFIIGIIPILYCVVILSSNLRQRLKMVINIIFVSISVLGIWELYKLYALNMQFSNYFNLQRDWFNIFQLHSLFNPNLLIYKLTKIEAAFRIDGILILFISLFIIFYIFFQNNRLNIYKLLSFYSLTNLLYFLILDPNSFYRHFFSSIALLAVAFPYFIFRLIEDKSLIKRITIVSSVLIILISFYKNYYVYNYLYPQHGIYYTSALVNDEYSWPYLEKSDKLISQYKTASYIKENIPSETKLTGVNWWNAPEISFLIQRRIYRKANNSSYTYLIKHYFATTLEASVYKLVDLTKYKRVYFDEYYELYKRI